MLAKALTGNITDYGNEKTIPLHKIAILKNGTSITSSKIKHGNIPVIAGGREPAYYHNEENRSEPTITVTQSGAYAGFVSYHDKPIFASDCFTITAKPNSGYSTLDLYYLLKKKQKQIYSFATGSIQKHVYAKDMEDFKVPDKG
ncbi:N-6 DNA methylase, partial [Veillonellaceae bacterium M2-4]|nr:N-6 DNA methylase [Veillonellaceae bacterium M2-4]